MGNPTVPVVDVLVLRLRGVEGFFERGRDWVSVLEE
jgi:hypothetical protein